MFIFDAFQGNCRGPQDGGKRRICFPEMEPLGPGADAQAHFGTGNCNGNYNEGTCIFKNNYLRSKTKDEGKLVPLKDPAPQV